MNRSQLVRRDSALAALMGATVGAQFGGDFSFGDDYGDDVGDDMGFGDDVGFGDDYGDDMGAAPRRRAPKPTPHAAIAAYHKLHAARAKGQKRVEKLDPNADSTVKVERYAFSLSQNFVLGTGGNFDTNLSGTPDTTFRPQVVTINAPSPGFAYVSNIKMANVNVTVGPGLEDAYDYAAQAWGKSMDMPTLSPSNRATVSGQVTTFVPPGFVQASTYILSVNFKGPSSLAGGMVGQ